MIKRWRALGVDKLIKQAAEYGAILSGVSAGGMAWFRFGISDSWRAQNNPKVPLIRIRPLNYVNALFCPHYDKEEDCPAALKKIMRRTPGVAIALGDCAAIEIIGEQYRFLRSKPDAIGYRIYWHRFSERVDSIESTPSIVSPSSATRSIRRGEVGVHRFGHPAHRGCRLG
jgi:hypothetical protein